MVVDLGAVGRASVALARWYRGLVSTGEADPTELGSARADLAALPAQPGPLGRAVQLVVDGGDNATDDEIVAAVALLCDAASRAGPAPVPAGAASARPGTRLARPVQPTLPGMGQEQ